MGSPVLHAVLSNKLAEPPLSFRCMSASINISGQIELTSGMSVMARNASGRQAEKVPYRGAILGIAMGQGLEILFDVRLFTMVVSIIMSNRSAPDVLHALSSPVPP